MHAMFGVLCSFYAKEGALSIYGAPWGILDVNYYRQI